MLKYLLPILSALILGGCFFEKTPMPLHNVYWKLVELKDENVQKMDNRPGPYLFFHTNDRSLHGSDGCNTLQGEYRQDEKGFRFINIRSSRIYCEAQMEQAETFYRAWVLRKRSKSTEIRLSCTVDRTNLPALRRENKLESLKDLGYNNFL